MYIAILTEAGKEVDGAIDRVHEHQIMSALLSVRQAWEKVKGERVERIEARLEPVMGKGGGRSKRGDETVTAELEYFFVYSVLVCDLGIS